MNPRLDFYKITLKAKREKLPTFGSFAIEHLGRSFNSSEKAILDAFRNHFVTNFGEDYAISTKHNMKVFIPKDTVNKYKNLKPVADDNYKSVSGVISGGPFNLDRSYMNATTGEEGRVTRSTTVGGYFYFFLYLPPDHNVGCLIIHSNSIEDNITKMVKNYVIGLFKKEPFYLNIEAYAPKELQKRFLENSTLDEIVFENEYLTDSSVVDGIKTKPQHFKIKIVAVPDSKDIPLRRMQEEVKKISKFLFGKKDKEIELSSFPNNRVRVKEASGKQTKTLSLNIDNEITAAYTLTDRTEFQSNGTPVLEKLDEHCKDVFKNIVLPDLRPDLDVTKF